MKKMGSIKQSLRRKGSANEMILDRQFGSNRAFISHSSEGLPVWKNISYSRRALYEPLLTLSEKAIAVGNLIHDGVEHILFGSEFFTPARPQEQIGLKATSTKLDLLEQVKVLICQECVPSPTFLRLPNTKAELFNKELFWTILGGTRSEIAFGIIFFLEERHLHAVLTCIMRHSLTDVDGPLNKYGNWRAQKRMIYEQVSRSRIALDVRAGSVRLFCSDRLRPEVDKLTAFLERSLNARSREAYDGSFWKKWEKAELHEVLGSQ